MKKAVLWMVHLTIVLSSSIKAACFMSLLIRRKWKAACSWLTASTQTWIQINQTIAGSALIRLRRAAAVSAPQTNSSAASVVPATGRSLSLSRGPASPKPFTLPLRTDAIWKADRNTSRPTELVFCLWGLVLHRGPLWHSTAKTPLSAVACIFFQDFVSRPQSGSGSCCYNFLHENDVIYFRETKDI